MGGGSAAEAGETERAGSALTYRKARMAFEAGNPRSTDRTLPWIAVFVRQRGAAALSGILLDASLRHAAAAKEAGSTAAPLQSVVLHRGLALIGQHFRAHKRDLNLSSFPHSLILNDDFYVLIAQGFRPHCFLSSACDLHEGLVHRILFVDGLIH